MHYSAVNFFTLVRQDGERNAEASEDLLDEDFSNRLCFFISQWKGLCPFREAVHARQYVDMASIRPVA